MNEFYCAFIEAGRRLAVEHELVWEMPCDAAGKVPYHLRWDLAKLRGLPPPPMWLANFCFYPPAIEPLNMFRAARGLPPAQAGAMPAEWRDFVKAAVLNELLVKQNKPGSAERNLAPSLCTLAACADGLAPRGTDRRRRPTRLQCGARHWGVRQDEPEPRHGGARAR